VMTLLYNVTTFIGLHVTEEFHFFETPWALFYRGMVYLLHIIPKGMLKFILSPNKNNTGKEKCPKVYIPIAVQEHRHQ